MGMNPSKTAAPIATTASASEASSLVTNYAKDAAKPSIFRRLVKGPGLLHSMYFGVLGGLAFWALMGVYRIGYLAAFDSDTIPRESRRRFQEKQEFFQQKTVAEQTKQALIELITEYDPASLTVPFQKPNPKWLV